MKSLILLLALSQAVAAADSGAEAWARAMAQAKSLSRQHRFAEALAAVRRVLPIARRFGPLDTRLAETYDWLGSIQRDMGACTEAPLDDSRAIAIWERQPSPPARPLFNSIVFLLDTLCECGRTAAAEKAFRSYEAILQRYATTAEDQVEMLNLRAAIAKARNNYPLAESCYRQALQWLEQSPDGAPVQIAETRINMALAIWKEGRTEESLAESDQVLDFLDHSFIDRDKSHPGATVVTLNNAACALSAMGRKVEAERLFERALAAALDAYGENTRVTATVMLNYAKGLREAKQSKAAEVMQKRGEAAFRNTLAGDNATVDVADLGQ